MFTNENYLDDTRHRLKKKIKLHQRILGTVQRFTKKKWSSRKYKHGDGGNDGDNPGLENEIQ